MHNFRITFGQRIAETNDQGVYQTIGSRPGPIRFYAEESDLRYYLLQGDEFLRQLYPYYCLENFFAGIRSKLSQLTLSAAEQHEYIAKMLSEASAPMQKTINATFRDQKGETTFHTGKPIIIPVPFPANLVGKLLRALGEQPEEPVQYDLFTSDSTTALTTGSNTLAQAIIHWEKLLKLKENEASEYSLKLQNVGNTLRVFLGEYNTRIGIHYIRLDLLRLEIRMYEYRLYSGTPKKVLGVEDLATTERLVQEKFGAEHEALLEKLRIATSSSDEYRKELSRKERFEMLSEEAQQQIKSVFRKLALIFHPDKAQNDEERNAFTGIMTAINEAYANGDETILQRYLEKAEKQKKIALETPVEHLARLKQEFIATCEILEKLVRELEQIYASDEWKLYIRTDDEKATGTDLLAELARRAQNDIAIKKEILNDLVQKYRNITEATVRASGGTP
jgi:hypothetical protein